MVIETCRLSLQSGSRFNGCHCLAERTLTLKLPRHRVTEGVTACSAYNQSSAREIEAMSPLLQRVLQELAELSAEEQLEVIAQATVG